MFRPSFRAVESPMGFENLTLTESQLEDCRPVRARGGRSIRAFCPFHGSDRQRSLSVETETGRFHCFACGAWGYMGRAREQWNKNRRNRMTLTTSPAKLRCTPPQPLRTNLAVMLQDYRHALPGSIGEEYLHSRGITLQLAQRYALGYASAGKWAHRSRDWKCGRIVFPHNDPQGNLVNLYGRAVGKNSTVPRDLRHDHLPGYRGYLNASILREAQSVFVTEGPFDALSLIAAGQSESIAIFGVAGWRWEWARSVASITLAFDADTTGQQGWLEIARQGRLHGKRVTILPPEAYGDAKDANEAWVAGTLNVAA